jgi:concanavalin A-like lectin/glucanase superfamily protein
MKASRYLFYSLVLLTCFVAQTKAAINFVRTDGDYYTFSLPTGFSTNTYSMSAWLNLTSETANEYPAIVHLDIGSKANGIYIEGNSVLGATFGIVFVVANTTTNNAVLSTAFSTGTWIHICGTWNGTTSLIYLNGVVQTNTYTDGNYTGISPYEFGRGDGGNLLNGKLDDLRIYNHALTSQEVLSLAKSRSRLNITTGLIAYWPMTSGIVGQVSASFIDKSGNNDTATAVSSPTWTSGTLNFP